ncbi:MAG TPA: DUF4294 domain-containing protein [Puia sp.]|nr:DUF4294 domain-containing protein [Puia sp.]
MPLFRLRYLWIYIPFILLMMVQSAFAQQQQPSSKLSQQQQDSIKRTSALQQFNNRFGKNDTIWSQVIIYDGDTIPAKTLTVVFVDKAMTRAMHRRMEALTRLRNAVYVTYPYARKAGMILNDMNTQLAKMNSESQRKDYIKGKEKELKKEFTDPLEKLSVYQGQILMKLINRQTGNNCYDIIKEYRGGFSARLWQTVAFFFGSSLKQSYDAQGDDHNIEVIVQEVERMYRG